MRLTNLIAFTATALLMTGAAMAQDIMTAHVPFEFQFAGVTMPAGQYRVDSSRSRITGVMVIQNRETHQARLSIGVPNFASAVSDYNKPRLLFRCGASGCTLQQVRTVFAEYAWSAPKSDGPQHIATVPLSPAKAD